MIRASVRASGRPWSKAWHESRLERLWAELTRSVSVMEASVDNAKVALTVFKQALAESKSRRPPQPRASTKRAAAFSKKGR